MTARVAMSDGRFYKSGGVESVALLLLATFCGLLWWAASIRYAFGARLEPDGSLRLTDPGGTQVLRPGPYAVRPWIDQSRSPVVVADGSGCVALIQPRVAAQLAARPATQAEEELLERAARRIQARLNAVLAVQLLGTVFVRLL